MRSKPRPESDLAMTDAKGKLWMCGSATKSVAGAIALGAKSPQHLPG
jgi:hypothetical protein